ncbi:hypothetical protein RvY_08430 [Ramazzottius varieornatus]|uniref:HTH CENPB-type domain-containing protein n=1 Tax=Ramazzottius varieornatus TaxID=947166 RepID=A0A1D1V5V2_RAMVA|nr:hypothetical protein RvY_08430 [Ramazzottius varieornatus]
MGLSVAAKLGIEGFKAFRGWEEKFRKRRGIVLRVTTKIGRRFARTDEDEFWIKEPFDERHDGGTLIRDRASARGSAESQLLLESMGIEQVFIPAGLTAYIMPEPLYMLADQEEILDTPDDLETSFECSSSSVEDSFTEE